jgi:poly(3-hydroxybutyrate) depolymerase
MHGLYEAHDLTNLILNPFYKEFNRHSLFWKGMTKKLPFANDMYAFNGTMARLLDPCSKKPGFNLETTIEEGKTFKIHEKIVLKHPFCDLIHFEKQNHRRHESKVLLVAPLSGHYATLLRDTAKALLPFHDVYITDWKDAKNVPLSEGSFSFDDYVDYVLNYIHYFEGDIHLIAVCQPSVPVLIAVSLLAEDNHKHQPKSMTLMGGPIDTRINPGIVDKFAQEKSLEWFEQNFIATVPAYYPGAGRRVTPGFIMLNGFMSMNTERHIESFKNYYDYLAKGDEEKAQAHQSFYNEYRAVLDLPADYYLESIEIVFQKHLLGKGELTWRGVPVNPQAIQKTALFTVEGEKDDISPLGQTYAAQQLCTSLSNSKRSHYEQKGAGHYGIFSGHRWRDLIRPQISEFIESHDHDKDFKSSSMGNHSHSSEGSAKRSLKLPSQPLPTISDTKVGRIIVKQKVKSMEHTNHTHDHSHKTEEEKKVAKKKVAAKKTATKKPAAKKAAPKKAVAKKTVAKKATVKKVAVKKAAPKKTAAKKATVKKVVAKKTVAKKATVKKVVAKKTVAKKAAPKKVVAKKVIKKTVAKKAVAKKVVAKKAIKKTVAKKSVAKKVAHKKVAVKKVVKKTAHKKVAVKKVAHKKLVAKKVVAKKTAHKKVAKKAAPRRAAAKAVSSLTRVAAIKKVAKKKAHSSKK